MTRKEIIKAITKEVRRAKRKFPAWPRPPMFGFFGWGVKTEVTRIIEAGVIGEEAGEVMKAALNLQRHDPHTTTEREYRQEIIQTAAMCFRALEGL